MNSTEKDSIKRRLNNLIVVRADLIAAGRHAQALDITIMINTLADELDWQEYRERHPSYSQYVV